MFMEKLASDFQPLNFYLLWYIRIRGEKLRPVTLKTLASLLHDIRRSNVDVSSRRIKELIRFLYKLKLIKIDGRFPKLTSLGEKFIAAYQQGDSITLHEIFLSIKEYKDVYEAYINGHTGIQDIARVTGLNAVVIDVVLRLISEIESISLENVVNKEFYQNFVKILVRNYIKLTKKNRSRYVELVKLRSETKKSMFITNSMFKKLLELFIRENKDKVILSGAPLTKATNINTIELFGKRFAYIMIDIKEVYAS